MKATEINGIQAIFAGTENNGVILSTDEGSTWVTNQMNVIARRVNS